VGIDLSQHNFAELEPNAVSPVHVSSDDSKYDCNGSAEEWYETDAEDCRAFHKFKATTCTKEESAFIEWMAILIFSFQSAFFLPNPAAELVLLLLRWRGSDFGVNLSFQNML